MLGERNRMLRSLAGPLIAILLAAGCAQVQTTAEVEPTPQVQSTPAEIAPAPPAPVAQAPAPAPVVAPAPPPPPANVWERIRAGYRMAPLNTPLVQEWEQYYAHRP